MCCPVRRRGKGEEEQDTANDHAQHPLKLRVQLDKDRVVPRIGSVPIRMGPDPFAAHPSDTTHVARRVKRCDGGMEDVDAAMEGGASIDGHRVTVRIGVKEGVEEAAKELGECGLENVQSEIV